MEKVILLSSAFLFSFLFNSPTNANTFEKNLSTITPVDTDFISQEIVLTCDENFQKGEKRFQGFISSEYVWAYRNSGKFINLLFGYETKSNGFRIEVLEKGLDARSPRYYNFHDKNSKSPQAILAGKVIGYKVKSNQNWYSCSLNYLQPNSENKQRETGSVSVRDLRRKLFFLETFHKLQKKAIAQLEKENHPVNLYLDFRRHKELLKQEIAKIEVAAKEPKQPTKSQTKVPGFEQVQQQRVDKLESQIKLLSEKLSKLHSVRLSSEKELKVIRKENASLKSEVSSLRSEKLELKNEKNYEPSVARLLMPDSSHGYLDKFEKNTLGWHTTEQIVVLLDQIISLDKINRQLRIKQGELKSEIEASVIKISELEMSLEEMGLEELESNNSKIKKKINWETDCRIGPNKIFPISVGRTRRPLLAARAWCLNEQYYQCSDNMAHATGTRTENSEKAFRDWKEAMDIDLSTFLNTDEPTRVELFTIEHLYTEAIIAYQKAIIEIQQMGASCSGPLRWP